MKTIIEKSTGLSIFYIKDRAVISFVPHLVIENNGDVFDNYIVPALTQSDVEVHEGLPEINWKSRKFKVQNGQWIDCSAEIDAAHKVAVAADVLTKRDAILAECADKTSPEWVSYKSALANIESLPGFPFTHDFPQKPQS